MSGNIKRVYFFVMTGFCAMGLFTAAHAAGIELHGYGYQDYVQASKDTYLGADKKGTWDNNFLGLEAPSASMIRANCGHSCKPARPKNRFTWFFVDYQFTNQLRGHIGRVKLPMGLYNEVIDAKNLQISQLEPSIYQGASDMMYDAYHGVGLDYDHDVGAGHLMWQVYAGNIYDYTFDIATADAQDRRTFGGRITYRTPVDGLRFMLTLNRVQMQVITNGIKDSTMRDEDRAPLCQLCNGDYVAKPYMRIISACP